MQYNIIISKWLKFLLKGLKLIRKKPILKFILFIIFCNFFYYSFNVFVNSNNQTSIKLAEECGNKEIINYLKSQ